MDRIFRDAEDALTTAKAWRDAGISLHLADLGDGESINTGSSMGKMFFTLLAAFAELEANMISERATAALRHKKAHGEVYNHVPFGMRAEDGKLVADPTEQATIARMTTLRQQGLSYEAIARSSTLTKFPPSRVGKAGGQDGVEYPQGAEGAVSAQYARICDGVYLTKGRESDEETMMRSQNPAGNAVSGIGDLEL